MILFKKDWEKYPSAIPDKKTNNGYFLDFAAKLYREAGVENCLWPISLLNPEIQGLDPRSPKLTFEEKLAIKNECYNNIWYYLRECLLIPPAVGEGGNQFRANRANMSLIWSYCNHIDYLLIQPRQTGKSISSDALSSWLLYVKYRNTRIGLVTKSDELRAENASRLRRIKEYLPAYLVVQDRNDSLSNEMVTYKSRGNRYAIAVSRADENGAYRVGRGNTTPTNIWDEAPYIANIRIAYSACMASGDAVIQEAKKKGLPYGSIITTTAGKQDDRDGAFIYKLWAEAMRWSDKLYDCKDEDDLRETVKRHCKGRKILINGTWSHLQVGVSDKQHYENMAKNAAEGGDADRDYFNIWTVGGMKNPLDKELLARINASAKYSEYSEILPGGFIIHWYLTRDELEARRLTLPAVVGSDTSEGGGRDALSLVIEDYTDLSVLGVSVVNEALIPRYADFLFEFMMRYPTSVLIPERKSTGQTFIDYLCIRLHAEGVDPFARIYNTIVQDHEVNPDAYMEISRPMNTRDDSFYVRRKTKFGFCTGTTTRKTLYQEILKIAARKGAGKVHDKQLIAEISGLEDKNGRVDHSRDGHDDTVIAWLLPVWLLVYGRNLGYYGIDRKKVLAKAVEEDNQTPEERMASYQLDELNDAMEETIKVLRETNNPVLITKYEAQLRYLEGELQGMGVQNINVSSLIEEMNATRRRDAYSRYR